jgi:hydroxyacylglutathione hydrolase
MSALQIHQFPCLSDNFGVLVHDPVSGATLAIDAPEEAAVMNALKETGWQLTDLFITHHHPDHVGGVAALKAEFKPRIVGPRAESDKIENLDVLVAEGDSLSFAGRLVEIIDTPGHTLGHIAYVIRSEPVAFVGDTLFSLGCGRIIEGTPEQMWASLQKLAALPPETVVYCGHEYTLSNGRFAVTVDGTNQHLLDRMVQIQHLRAEGKATLPTTIGEELLTNPFFRASAAEVKAGLDMPGGSDLAVFTKLREMKNDFRG